jgi:hypothetical protein
MAALLHERKTRHTNPALEQKLVFYFVAVWLAQLDHAIKSSTLQKQLDSLIIKKASS